jgi:hypothetical protein
MHTSHKISPHKTLTKEGFRGNQCLKCGCCNTPPLDIGLDFECNVTDDEYEDVLYKRNHMKGRWGSGR